MPDDLDVCTCCRARPAEVYAGTNWAWCTVCRPPLDVAELLALLQDGWRPPASCPHP